MRVPVRLTRCPTWVGSFAWFAESTTSTGALCFLRKPDFQLRDLGAASPTVSRSLNVSASRSRQPVIVTAGGRTTSTIDDDSAAAGLSVGSITDPALTGAGDGGILSEWLARGPTPTRAAAPTPPSGAPPLV